LSADGGRHEWCTREKGVSFSIVASNPREARLAIDGKLDDASIYVLRLELANLLRQHPKRVELFMARSDCIDNSGRGLLLSFFAVLQSQGGLLTLRNPHDPPVEVLELPQMERLLKVRPDTLG
jgi:anti-anti-sigma regulatory factor